MLDPYELCLELTNDPEKCSVGVQITKLAEGLEKCIKRGDPEKCFEKCVEECGGGEDCPHLCRVAVDAAVARGVVEEILKKAVEMVIESKFMISIPEAAALYVSNLLASYVNDDCVTKDFLFHTMGIAITELRNVVDPDLILLFAPLISTVHGYVEEDEIDSLLEEIKNAAGEQTAGMISEALDTGKAAIRRIKIYFAPVR